MMQTNKRGPDEEDPILERPGTAPGIDQEPRARFDPDDGATPPWDGTCRSCGAAHGLSIAVCLTCRDVGFCTVCGEEHRATQCPLVRQARLDMLEAERLMHQQMITDWASKLRDAYAAAPIWMEAA